MLLFVCKFSVLVVACWSSGIGCLGFSLGEGRDVEGGMRKLHEVGVTRRRG